MTKSRKTGHLLTEKINPRTAHLDQCSTDEIVRLILAEDGMIPGAVQKEKRRIAEAVELIVERMVRGGRLIFIGAGTSGRLGVMEAAECPPTFGTDPSLIRAIIAGGRKAFWRSVEGAEDSAKEARKELRKINLGENDVLVGIAASATTPFVESALSYAQKKGSGKILVTCNRADTGIPDVVVSILAGPEAIVGSTRMKAGTATKMVLNMLTTATMVKLGKTYGNLMVDVLPRSAKLRDRAVRIVTEIAVVDEREAGRLLRKSGWDVKASVVMAKKGIGYKKAKDLLFKNNGFLRKALS
ncbi:MAG TPA: N-acetylmuramic acid 6-phosphate etherase [Thermodesulfobacteriota bacterium]|nr:N-acetylmuramic acid 6-phosphate etherase [Thermodesulfobacteriota bacterium]